MENLEEKVNNVSNWQILKAMGRDVANAGKSAGKYLYYVAVSSVIGAGSVFVLPIACSKLENYTKEVFFLDGLKRYSKTLKPVEKAYGVRHGGNLGFFAGFFGVLAYSLYVGYYHRYLEAAIPAISNFLAVGYLAIEEWVQSAKQRLSKKMAEN